MNLYEIKERLRKQEKAVLTINEFARILNIKKEIARVYTHRMAKKGLIIKIEKNKISTTDDPFIISSQLTFPSYISLTSALYLHNIIQQIPDTISILTTRQKKQLNSSIVRIKFIQIKPKNIFGYKKVKKEASFIMLADLEKTILDCLAFLRYCRLPYILEALKQADIKKIESYLDLLNSEALIRRTGYLLDHLGKRHNLKRKTNIIYKLNPSIKRRGIFNKKWYLYINENGVNP